MNSLVYSGMKSVNQVTYNELSYYDLLLNSLIPMLNYENFPESIPVEIFERYKLESGVVAIFKINDKFVCSPAQLGGDPDEYGIGKDAICTTCDGQSFTFSNWRENTEVSIFFNNSTYSADFSIARTGATLAEIETSLKCLLKYSRFFPIPLASDTKQKAAFEEFFKRITIGDYGTIGFDGLMSKLLEDGNADIPTLTLTDPELAEKIQFISKYRDDVFRWFYSVNGMNSQGSAKLAQQTVDEVNQDNNASMILVFDRLNQAIKDFKKFNEKNPDAPIVTPYLSQCWQSRVKDLDSDDDGIIDEGGINGPEETEHVENGATGGQEGEHDEG